MNGWHFYLIIFIFILYHKEEVTSIKQNEKSDHSLFDEDFLVFENVPSRKKRTSFANVLELGSGLPDGITREDLTTEIITSKSWTVSNLVVLFPESSEFSQQRKLIDPNRDFSRVYLSTLILLKNISNAGEVTGEWTTNSNSKPIKYSLNVYLSWSKLLKNSNDIQNYGNVFATNKNILNSSLPPGFHLLMDSHNFNIMPSNDLTSTTLAHNSYITENSTFPTELLFDESTIKNFITSLITEGVSSSIMTITQPFTQPKITKGNVIASEKIPSSITSSDFSSTLSPSLQVATQIKIDNVVVIFASLRNAKLNSTDFEPNELFSNVTVITCNLLKELSSANNVSSYWTIKNSNGAKSYALQVTLIFTNTVLKNSNIQQVLKVYKNKCAPVLKMVANLGFQAEIAPGNMNIKVLTSDSTKEQPMPEKKDYTGFILVIVLPLLGVLIITVLAFSICYCWFKYRNSHELNTETVVTSNLDMPKTSSELSNQTKKRLEPSMFVNQKSRKTFNQIETESLDEENSDTGTHSQYRANYPIEFNPHALEDNFFKSLENNVRSSQKQTIVRPQSIFTDSSFSIPTNYYDQTTPYSKFQNSKFKKYQIESDETDKDLIQFDDNEEEDDECGISKYNEFDDDFGMPGEFIEAFNPNVQIPRPKIQLKPLSIFNDKPGVEPTGSISRQEK